MSKDLADSANVTQSRTELGPLRAFLLCQQGILSKQGMWSLINIFDRVNVVALPVELQFVGFLSIATSPGSHEVRVTGCRPDEPEQDLVEVTAQTGPRGGHHVHINVDLRVEKPGPHLLNAYLDGNLIGMATLLVEIREPEAAAEVVKA